MKGGVYIAFRSSIKSVIEMWRENPCMVSTRLICDHLNTLPLASVCVINSQACSVRPCLWCFMLSVNILKMTPHFCTEGHNAPFNIDTI